MEFSCSAIYNKLGKWKKQLKQLTGMPVFGIQQSAYGTLDYIQL